MRPKIIVKPPGPKSTEWLERNVKVLAGTNMVYTPGLITAHGEGCFVTDPDGNVFLDLCQSRATEGHSNRKIIEYVKEYMDREGLTGGIYTTTKLGSKAMLSEMLLKMMPGKLQDIGKVAYCNSGTESCDYALSIARMETNRKLIFAFEGAYHGMTGIPGLLPFNSKVPYYYFFLVLGVVCLLFLYRFERCRIGVTLKAINQSYLVAASVGINETKYRVLVMAVGCFFAGLAGGTYAHYMRALSYTSFDLLATLWLFMYALIGGMGQFAGPIIGTAILIIVPELLRGLKEYVPYISAVILLIVVFVMPEGLVGLPKLVRSLMTKLDFRKADPDAS